MRNLIMLFALAAAIIGCSGDRQVNSDKPMSLVGTYKGSMQAYFCSNPDPIIGQVDSVTFIFAESTYWWQGNLRTRLPEWGSGPYHVDGDSLYMTDRELRTWERCYVICDGWFRIAQSRDTLRIWQDQPMTTDLIQAILVKY